MEVSKVCDIRPQNRKYLRDAFGSPITEGSCVVDHERQVGYVRFDLGPHCPGPGSAYWDRWFNVTATCRGNPLRGTVMRGDLVQLLSGNCRGRE